MKRPHSAPAKSTQRSRRADRARVDGKAGAAMPSLREQLKRETRARLEKAAVELLSRHGYQATSVERIVKLAGTTRTTFYDHFKSSPT